MKRPSQNPLLIVALFVILVFTVSCGDTTITKIIEIQPSLTGEGLADPTLRDPGGEVPGRERGPQEVQRFEGRLFSAGEVPHGQTDLGDREQGERGDEELGTARFQVHLIRLA